MNAVTQTQINQLHEVIQRQQEALDSLLFLAQDALEKSGEAKVDAKQVEITCIEGLGGEE